MNLISTDGKKITIKKTDVKCWWDCNTFTNLPCMLPNLYFQGAYRVIGCYCIFNCMLEYNLYYLKDSRVYERKSLAYAMYRNLYGLKPGQKVIIEEAPPRELLKDFGGSKTIQEFRESFKVLNKKYMICTPPIKCIDYTIEERTKSDSDDDEDFVLKSSNKKLKGNYFT